MAKAEGKSVDLGALQSKVESTAATFKAAATNLRKAQEAFDRAESEYHAATDSHLAGVKQLRESTKVV